MFSCRFTFLSFVCEYTSNVEGLCWPPTPVCAGHLHLFVILVILYVAFVVVLKYWQSTSRHVGEDILQHCWLLSVLGLWFLSDYF